MSISSPVSTFHASLWFSIFCQIRHYAHFHQCEGTEMEIDTKNICEYLHLKLSEEQGIIAGFRDLTFYDKYNWWHKCSSVPLIWRQVPIKLPWLKALVMKEGALWWFPVSWTGARLFQQMNLSRCGGFIWIQINNCLSNLKETTNKTGTASAPEVYLLCWAINWS